jgi:hypothetical protein
LGKPFLENRLIEENTIERHKKSKWPKKRDVAAYFLKKMKKHQYFGVLIFLKKGVNFTILGHFWQKT